MAALIMILTVGASAAVVGVLDRVLFRAASFPSDLFVLGYQTPYGGVNPIVTGAHFRAISEADRFFDEVAAAATFVANVTVDGRPVQSKVLRTTGNFFRMLDVEPYIGRDPAATGFTTAEPVAIVSYKFWRRLFGENDMAVSSSIEVNGILHAVVGVMGRDLLLPGYLTADIFIPTQNGSDAALASEEASVYTIVRTARVPHGAINNALQEVKINLTSKTEARFKGATPTIIAVGDLVRPEKIELYYLILAGVFLLLMVAFTNASSLMLLGTIRREREFGIRMALGATTARVAWTLVKEHLVFGLTTCLGALLVSNWASGAMALLAEETARGANLNLGYDLRDAVVAMGLGTCGCIWVMIHPLSRLYFADGRRWLRTGASTFTEGRLTKMLRSWTLVLQLALTMALISTASLLFRTFASHAKVDVGFDAERLVFTRLLLPAAVPRSEAGVRAAYIAEAVRRIPGVQDVAIASDNLLSDGYTPTILLDQGSAEPLRAELVPVSENYFATSGIPVLRGRSIRVGSSREVIINEALAHEVFGRRDPIGEMLRLAGGKREFEVVGLVGSTKYSLRAPVGNYIYVDWRTAGFAVNTVILRVTEGRVPEAALQVRQTALAADQATVVTSVGTGAERVASQTHLARFTSVCINFFSLLSAAIAACGIFAAMSDQVVRRRSEFGIRICLGAKPVSVVALIMKSSCGIAIFSSLVGAIGAAVLARILASAIFDVHGEVLAGIAVGAVGILVLASLASILPAVRAASIAPSDLMREMR